MQKQSHLQAVDHVLLRVHRLALLLNESFSQHACVELLVDIFVVHILEYGDAVAKLVIHLTLIQTLC